MRHHRLFEATPEPHGDRFPGRRRFGVLPFASALKMEKTACMNATLCEKRAVRAGIPAKVLCSNGFRNL
jgi:hypothetical protein